MLYKNRQKFEKLRIVVGSFFGHLSISPNQWTLLTFIPLVITLYFLVMQDFLLAAIFFIITAFFDFIDGSVANVKNNVTKSGAYLDTIVDRYVEGIIIIGLLFISLPSLVVPASIWIVIYLFGSLMTTYVKAAAKEKDIIKKELNGGILERAERLIILFVGIALAYFNTLYLLYVIIILAVLTNISTLQRIYYALKGA